MVVYYTIERARIPMKVLKKLSPSYPQGALSIRLFLSNRTFWGQTFWGQTYTEQAEGSGSGIIVAQDDKHLLIATNNHVVKDSASLEVQFIDLRRRVTRCRDADLVLTAIYYIMLFFTNAEPTASLLLAIEWQVLNE